MRRLCGILFFAAFLLVPGLASAESPVAPAPEIATLFAAPNASELTPVESELPALDGELGLPEPLFAACTFTDYCRSCSRGLQFCRRTCCNGSCSTSCGVCGAC